MRVLLLILALALAACTPDARPAKPADGPQRQDNHDGRGQPQVP